MNINTCIDKHVEQGRRVNKTCVVDTITCTVRLTWMPDYVFTQGNRFYTSYSIFPHVKRYTTLFINIAATFFVYSIILNLNLKLFIVKSQTKLLVVIHKRELYGIG